MRKIVWLMVLVIAWILSALPCGSTRDLFAQNPFKAQTTVVKSLRYESSYSGSRGDTLAVVSGANDTSAYNWPEDCESWLVTGWAIGVSVDSVPSEPVADSLFVEWSYRFKTGDSYGSWARIDTIVGPYGAIPKPVEYTVVTVPSLKPETVRVRFIAQDADSSVGMARVKWLAW